SSDVCSSDLLQAELSRPIEITPGRVSVPEASVGVDSDITVIAIRGDVATLHAAWVRLADIFAGRQPLDTAPPVEVTFSAAPRDVTSRFGLTSVTLATSQQLEVEAYRDPLSLLHYLNPAGGNVRAVMCTNTEALMTSVFAPPVTRPVGTEPSRYRAEARPGAMQFRAGYALISVVVPSSDDGAAAVRVLAQQVVQHIRDVTRRDLSLSVSMVSFGPEALATIMTHEVILHGAQRSQIQARLGSKPIPDHHITEAAEAEVRDLHLPRALANRGHGLDSQFATAAGTQQALAHARATMRFYTDPQSQPPPGYGPIADE